MTQTPESPDIEPDVVDATEEEEPKKRGPKAWVIAVIAVVVIVLIIAAAVIISSLGKNANTLPPPTATTSGQAATAGMSPGAPVAAADPTRIAIPAIGIDAAVKLYTIEDAQGAKDPLTQIPCYENGIIQCINPPSAMDVYWLQKGLGGLAFGDRPGTDATGNVVMSGHASSTKEAVFTKLYKLAAGDDIQITTANGTLTYTVVKQYRPQKSDIYSQVQEMTQQQPGRLILVTCDHSSPDVPQSGGSSFDNIVIVAQLKVPDAAAPTPTA